MSRADRFLRACRGEPVDTTPIWLMRQAGRYLPGYRELRSRYDFLDICHTPELVCRVTLEPVHSLGVDAAILFSDILMPFEALGLKLSFTESGPEIDGPLPDRAALEELSPSARADRVFKNINYLHDAVAITRRKLNGEVPLIGFAGGPFTLATYLVEGRQSKNHERLKTMMLESPEEYDRLMQTGVADALSFLWVQLAAGVDAVQIFDTWAGSLAPDDFRRFALPYVQTLIQRLRGVCKCDVPIIYYVNGCAGIMDQLASTGADVVSIDWRVGIERAVKELGTGVSVQGNLDPCALLGPADEIRPRARAIIEGARGARGHVFNLGHGVLPETDPERVRGLVSAVHELGRREGD